MRDGVKSFHTRTAEIVIAIRSVDADLRLRPEGAVERFVVEEGVPDVTLRATWGDLSQDRWGGRTLFNSGGLWQLRRSNGSYVFSFLSSALGSVPYKIARLAPDFASGDVLLHRDYFPPGQAIYPLEYPLDELLVTHWLAQGRGVVLHACALVDAAGSGYLFVGQSGAGKTTTARLWMKQPGITILSDDRIIVRKVGERFYMHGTPWHSDARIACPARAPLHQLFFLRHGKENEIAPLALGESVGRLFGASFPPFHSAAALEFTLGFLEEMARKAPCEELRFIPDDSAVEFVRRTKAEG